MTSRALPGTEPAWVIYLPGEGGHVMSTCATAEQALKDSSPRILRLAFVSAVLIHAVAFLAVPNPEFAPYSLSDTGPPPIEPMNFVIQPPEPVEEVQKRPVVRDFEPSDTADENATIDATVPTLEELLVPVPVKTVQRAPLTSFEVPPVPVHTVDPVYPDLARQAELEGTVGLMIVVDERGDVESATVVSSVPGLDEAAIAAVLQWKFEPARQRDVPVRVRVFQAVRFQLRG
jgi:protein TonB